MRKRLRLFEYVYEIANTFKDFRQKAPDDQSGRAGENRWYR